MKGFRDRETQRKENERETERERVRVRQEGLVVKWLAAPAATQL